MDDPEGDININTNIFFLNRGQSLVTFLEGTVQ